MLEAAEERRQERLARGARRARDERREPRLEGAAAERLRERRAVDRVGQLTQQSAEHVARHPREDVVQPRAARALVQDRHELRRPERGDDRAERRDALLARHLLQQRHEDVDARRRRELLEQLLQHGGGVVVGEVVEGVAERGRLLLRRLAVVEDRADRGAARALPHRRHDRRHQPLRAPRAVHAHPAALHRDHAVHEGGDRALRLAEAARVRGEHLHDRLAPRAVVCHPGVQLQHQLVPRLRPARVDRRHGERQRHLRRQRVARREERLEEVVATRVRELARRLRDQLAKALGADLLHQELHQLEALRAVCEAAAAAAIATAIAATAAAPAPATAAAAPIPAAVPAAQIEHLFLLLLARAQPLAELLLTPGGVVCEEGDAVELEVVPPADAVEQHAALRAVQVHLPDDLAEGVLPRAARRSEVAAGMLLQVEVEVPAELDGLGAIGGAREALEAGGGLGVRPPGGARHQLHQLIRSEHRAVVHRVRAG